MYIFVRTLTLFAYRVMAQFASGRGDLLVKSRFASHAGETTSSLGGRSISIRRKWTPTESLFEEYYGQLIMGIPLHEFLGQWQQNRRLDFPSVPSKGWPSLLACLPKYGNIICGFRNLRHLIMPISGQYKTQKRTIGREHVCRYATPERLEDSIKDEDSGDQKTSPDPSCPDHYNFSII